MIGRVQQKQMWERYLENIAKFWHKKYSASVVERNYPPIQSIGGSTNPFRSQLPVNLQKSRYINYNEIDH
jgi:hypothetical protein